MDEKPELQKTLADYVGKYPPKDLPIIFADNAPITGHGGGIIKFYLIRYDPSLAGDGTSNPQLVAQVVMPVANFAALTMFFNDEVQAMVKTGELDAKKVEELRQFYRKRREERGQNDAGV